VDSLSLSGTKSPEAQAAAAVFNDAQDNLKTLVKACSSGRELIERGFEEDVDLAGAYWQKGGSHAASFC
jgi:2-phosphosulfolactate phosphatase